MKKNGKIIKEYQPLIDEVMRQMDFEKALSVLHAAGIKMPRYKDARIVSVFSESGDHEIKMKDIKRAALRTIKDCIRFCHSYNANINTWSGNYFTASFIVKENCGAKLHCSFSLFISANAQSGLFQ